METVTHQNSYGLTTHTIRQDGRTGCGRRIHQDGRRNNGNKVNCKRCLTYFPHANEVEEAQPPTLPDPPAYPGNRSLRDVVCRPPTRPATRTQKAEVPAPVSAPAPVPVVAEVLPLRADVLPPSYNGTNGNGNGAREPLVVRENGNREPLALDDAPEFETFVKMRPSNLVNLMANPVILHDKAGPVATIQPAGPVARVQLFRKLVGYLDPGGVSDVPIQKLAYGKVENLPPPMRNRVYIVPKAVAERCPERGDLVYPDQLVRDAGFGVTACRCLAKLA